jgi:hypothetical protein
MNSDTVFRPSEEAKICLLCTKKKCKNSYECKRYKEKLREIKEARKHAKPNL